MVKLVREISPRISSMDGAGKEGEKLMISYSSLTISREFIGI